MCQAVRDGGRRCAVHRHASIGIIRAVRSMRPNLTNNQVERLFSELRREGRTHTMPREAFDIIRDGFLTTNELDEATRETVSRQFELSREHDDDIDAPTMYAFSTLPSRAAEREAALITLFEETAERTGYTQDEIRERFNTEYAGVDTRRGAETPTEYDQNTRRRAVLANLPYDRASVTAIERLRNLPEAPTYDTVNRITRVPAGPGRSIESWGYHNGRLEVQFRGSDTVHAYHNIHIAVWTRMQAERYPNSAFRQFILGRDEYLYASQEEADADATAYRCRNCGQFRSLDAHSCPESSTREDFLNQGLTSDETDARLALSHPQEEETPIADSAPSPVSREASQTTAPVDPMIPTVLALEGMDAYSNMDTSGFVPHEPVNFSFDHEKFLSRDSVCEMEQTSISNAIQQAIGRSNVGAKRADFTLTGRSTLHLSDPGGRFEPASDAEKVREFFQQASAANIRGAVLTQIINDRRVVVAMYSMKDFYLTFDHPERHSTDKERTASLNAIENDFDNSFSLPADHYESEVLRFQTTWGSSEEVVSVRASNVRGAVLPSNKGYNNRLITGPGKAALARAYTAGKAVRSELTFEVSTDSRAVRGGTDYGATESSGAVTAEVISRMNTEGEVEILDRVLKCSCHEYRRRYWCQHVSQASYDIPVALQFRSGIRPRIPGISNLNTADLNIRYSNELDGYAVIDGISSRHVSAQGEPVDNTAALERLNQLIEAETPENIRELSRDDRQLIYRAITNQIRPYSYGENFNSIEIAEPPAGRAEMLTASNAIVPIDAIYSDTVGRNTRVTGSVTLRAGSTPDNPDIVARSLRCGCDDYARNYDCEHVRDFTERRETASIFGVDENTNVESEVTHEMRSSLTRNYQAAIDLENNILSNLSSGYDQASYRRQETRAIRVIEQRMEAARREREALEQRARMYEDYRQSREQAWQETGTPIEDDLEAFQERVADLTRRRRRGETILEMQYENVTDGICAEGENTRSFGVEIEFDIAEGHDHSTVIRNIGRELHEAGLTSTSRQNYYHSSHGDWSEWSFEQDCTVAGEIVSPIMKDTPEHWRQLEQVIEIVNRNGGTASTRAGSHVHVSSGSFNMTRAPHAELTRLVRQDEDTLFRLASDPSRGTHRGARWCSPNISVATENIPPEDTQSWGPGIAEGHGSMLNYEGSLETSRPERAHVEFRMWDGSLNAAVIQQQVALSAAYVDLAERNVRASGGHYINDPDAVYRRLGDARSMNNRQAASDLTAEQFAASHRPVARMFDRLFRTDEQRDRITRLFAMTNDQAG